MFEMNKERQEYLSGQMGNLGTNILTVGFASYFFEKFSLSLRIGLCIIGCLCLYVGFLFKSSQKGV
jgi:hypothetical protein